MQKQEISWTLGLTQGGEERDSETFSFVVYAEDYRAARRSAFLHMSLILFANDIEMPWLNINEKDKD